MFNSYANYYDLFNQDKPYKKEIEFVYRWAGKPKSIFDIGCGTANYWKYYPKKTRIFGVDKSESMIDQSKDHSEILKADITKIKIESQFDCATALFDVINYIQKHDWWNKIPVKQGGYFLFDVWDTEKINKEGFRTTIKNVKNISRNIIPINHDGKSVELLIDIYVGKKVFREKHKMYLHTHADIVKFCGKEFEIDSVKATNTWQIWYKLRRK